MKIWDTVSLWRNATTILADAEKKPQHSQALRVLAALSAEWTRRVGLGHLNGRFAWPTTDAPGGDGSLFANGWLKEGILHHMGYSVGTTAGKTATVREVILSQVFACALPPVIPPSDLAEWGSPQTPTRLRKMAETIAALCRNAKRKHDSRLITAIHNWDHDLEFLYWNYYVEKFGFAWPTSDIQ